MRIWSSLEARKSVSEEVVLNWDPSVRNWLGKREKECVRKKKQHVQRPWDGRFIISLPATSPFSINHLLWHLSEKNLILFFVIFPEVKMGPSFLQDKLQSPHSGHYLDLFYEYNFIPFLQKLLNFHVCSFCIPNQAINPGTTAPIPCISPCIPGAQ